MVAPSVSESIRDKGLGLVSPINMTPVVIGASSLGTDNTVKAFSSIPKAIDERGVGPGVSALAEILATVGGPCLYVKADTSVAASNGSVTKSGAGPTVTIAGTALFDANILIVITLGGILGAGKFKYTLDNFTGADDSERTYSAELLIPSGGTFAIPSLGITATFPAGTYVLNETYSATVNCAAMNATDLNAAMDALDASGKKFRFVYVVTSNNAGDSTAHATLAAALQAKLTTLTTKAKYRRAIIAANVNGEDPAGDFTSLVAARLLVAYGRARITTGHGQIGYAAPTVPGATMFAIRAAGSLPSTDLKRVRGDGITNGGPLPNVLEIFEDEEKDPTLLGDIKVSTLRTWEGKSGFFICEGLLKSGEGSDFDVWPRGILMDIACETAHQVAVDWVGMGVRTNQNTDIDSGEPGADGTIDERDAQSMESEVEAALESQLLNPQNAEGNGGHVQAVAARINRSINVLTTGQIEVEISIVPRAHVRDVSTTLSYVISIPVAEAA
jgi:hypothetical protein